MSIGVSLIRRKNSVKEIFKVLSDAVDALVVPVLSRWELQPGARNYSQGGAL